jgi:hypothetical protein
MVIELVGAHAFRLAPAFEPRGPREDRAGSKQALDGMDYLNALSHSSKPFLLSPTVLAGPTRRRK